MSITSRDYVSATNPDCKAKQYTITIDGGYEASVITYGAVITDLIVPDKDGKPTDIMLGCKGLDEYMGNGANHGAVIGRSANRIKDASFVIDGVKYQIPKNEGENNLHSGNPGYQNVFWDAEILSEEEADEIILDSKIAGIPGCDGGAVLLSYTSPDGATGFPGNLDTKVLYCWLEDKTFLILYCGKTDKDTIFAPTNHAYFNLRGENAEGTVNNDLIMINSDKITIKDDMNVPTGELKDVEGTVFDCREYRFIG
ncbi:MAG: galactose-1-epimerase, partial [Clostridiales bacterium]|nr:galactose-1-epimerase [Clostridiales bacterium]